jgi:hypothetical protein
MNSLILNVYTKPGLSLLPENLDTPEARAMLIAIGLQESRFKYRTQRGGPAHGFWQFERGGGIHGVLSHPSTRDFIKDVCGKLRIAAEESTCYEAIVYNDPLACCFARLLLWTCPSPPPTPYDNQGGWQQYSGTWRPGKPHPETWEVFFRQAWDIVNADG